MTKQEYTEWAKKMLELLPEANFISLQIMMVILIGIIAKPQQGILDFGLAEKVKDYQEILDHAHGGKTPLSAERKSRKHWRISSELQEELV